MMNPRFWMPLLVALLLHSTVFAQTDKRIQAGKSLPVTSATAATGKWLERAALDPATYGKVRGVCPASSEESKIVLYTNELSEEFFKIALAVDKYVGDHPELAWSFVQVKDERGAQYGGYTAEELRARLDEIQAMAKKHGIKHLSFMVSAPGSHTTTPDKTVILAHVQTTGKPFEHPPVDWVIQEPASTLQGDTLTKHLADLDAVVRRP